MYKFFTLKKYFYVVYFSNQHSWCNYKNINKKFKECKTL